MVKWRRETGERRRGPVIPLVGVDEVVEGDDELGYAKISPRFHLAHDPLTNIVSLLVRRRRTPSKQDLTKKEEEELRRGETPAAS